MPWTPVGMTSSQSLKGQHRTLRAVGWPGGMPGGQASKALGT